MSAKVALNCGPDEAAAATHLGQTKFPESGGLESHPADPKQFNEALRTAFTAFCGVFYEIHDAIYRFDMIEVRYHQVIDKWMAALRDQRAAERIIPRTARARFGCTGDVKSESPRFLRRFFV